LFYSHVEGEAEIDRRDSIVRVEDHLIHGKRENAIDDAIASGDFATALLVASMCDPETYKSVAQKYAETKFRTDSPMYTTTSLFSGKIDDPSFWGKNPDELIENWKDNLAVILNNRTMGWDKVVLSLGDKLKEIGRIEEAHFCYMVCGHPIKSPTDKNTRVALLGCNHSDAHNLTLLTNESLNAFERTEAYEWAKRQANPVAYFETFQPFKLIYAMLLADSGEITQAQEFMKSIRLPANDIARSDSPEINRVSVSQMFDENEAFKLAYNEVKHQLQSKDGPKVKYAKLLESGGSLDIDTTRVQRVVENQYDNLQRRHKGLTNTASGPSIPRRGGNLQNIISNNDPALDATFVTAKTNLMGVSGYSLDGAEHAQSSKEGETNSMPPANEKNESGPKSVVLNPISKGRAIKPPRMIGSTKRHTVAKDTTTNMPPLQSTTNTKPPNNNKPEEVQPQSTMKPVVASTPHVQQQRPKSPPLTAPSVMMGKKTEIPKTPAPASGRKAPTVAPSSGLFGGMKSYLIKKLNPDSKECILPDNEEQAYFDEDLKRKLLINGCLFFK
jgi:hypothetical protein